MEGFTRKLSLFVPGLRSADYTTLFRRIRNLDLSFQVNPEFLLRDVVVAVDSTGIKVTNRGEWMREKWRVRRGGSGRISLWFRASYPQGAWGCAYDGIMCSILSNKGRSSRESRPGMTLRRDPVDQFIVQNVSE